MNGGPSPVRELRPGGTAPPAPLQPVGSYWEPPRQPAAPVAGLVYAGFWIRLGAYLIDVIPLLILSVVLMLPTISSIGDAVRGVPPPGPGVTVDSPEFAAYQALLMQRINEALAPMYSVSALAQLFSAAYFIGFWTWRGQTPGMMLLGLRIARDADGAPPGLARSILRYVGYVISGIVLFIGFIWVAFDRKKQGWHDKIAGTVVVRRAG
jgi:uncharacterized RDD family membrane protein YckC